MLRLTLRRLSYWAAVATLSAACATSENDPNTDQGGSSSAEAGAPDGNSSGKTSTGGTSAGTFSNGGSKAGSETTAGKDGNPTAGTETGGTMAVGEGGMAGMAAAGAPMADAGAAGMGEPPPECTVAKDCDDKNPCTNDDCIDTACQHTNNTDPCADDADDCTDDVCAAGQCTHPANTAPCEDDLDNCTNDLCAGDICTHPDNGTCACQKAADCNDSNPCTTDACVGNQCKYTNNSLGCINDQNPCTDDVCQAGACAHPDNTASCTDDGDACTGDVCSAGACTHPAVAGCCSGDGDCFDGNECTDDTCANNVCVHKNNALGCTADASPCTSEKCGGGVCKHPDNAVCSGSDDVVIFANRNSRYVVLNGTNLDWTGGSAASAEVFEKVGEAGTKFKLRSKTNGLYVTLGAGDALVATADLAGGMVFDAPTCGAPPWVGLNATTDLNGGAWAATDDGNHIISRSADCGPASATSWEKFQLISVTVPCTKPADCDDGNVCTDEVCGGNGFCAYTDHAGTCADDANACTDDVCNTGTCTHPGNGTCAGPLVAIQANRNAKFVVLNASYLEYTAAAVGGAAKFELVDKVGTQFKLRASNSMFVVLDAADNLIANATFANAMLFDSPVCDTNVGLIATSDDDAQKFVQAAAANRLIANNGSCGIGNAGAWEKWTLVPQ
jgi:hypothetical protein